MHARRELTAPPPSAAADVAKEIVEPRAWAPGNESGERIVLCSAQRSRLRVPRVPPVGHALVEVEAPTARQSTSDGATGLAADSAKDAQDAATDSGGSPLAAHDPDALADVADPRSAGR